MSWGGALILQEGGTLSGGRDTALSVSLSLSLHHADTQQEGGT